MTKPLEDSLAELFTTSMERGSLSPEKFAEMLVKYSPESADKLVTNLNWALQEKELMESPEEYDDSMDGDHQSALASAGMGTDEDYGGGDERL